jgi:glutamate racemase
MIQSNVTDSLSAPPRVLIFDSGVGGLSIADNIIAAMPWLDIVYASDNGFFPYGTKTEPELMQRIGWVINKLLHEHPVDLLVIACNTASTLALTELRSQFNLPIVGVVPAIKPAATLTRSNVIGLLATPATVQRSYTHKLINDYAPHCQVISAGSSQLVHIAEKKLRGESFNSLDVRHALSTLCEHPQSQHMDVLVLACTHFPLLKEEIREHLSPSVHIIDSGDAIARRVGTLLPHVDNPAGSITHTAVFTENTEDAQRLLPALVARNFKHHIFW